MRRIFVAMLALTACTQLLGVDKDYSVGDGVAGSGATFTSSGGGTGGSGTGGSATGGSHTGGSGNGGNATGGGGTGGSGQVVFFEDFSSGDWNSSDWDVEWLGSNSDVTVQNGEGVLDFGTANPAWGRATLLQPPLGDAEVAMRFRFNHEGTEGHLRVWLRASGDFGGDSQPDSAYVLTLVNSSGAMTLGSVIGGGHTALASGTWADLPDIGVYHLRFRVVGAQLSASVWRDTEAEPSSWELTATDSNVTGSGDLRLAYVKVSSARWVYVDDITLSSF